MSSKSPFQWQIPNKPPDGAALARMKQHFRQPKALMPEAWFMGEVTYYTWLATTPPELLKPKVLADALHELTSGIVAFFDAKLLVKNWGDWFKYLLPYGIDRIDDDPSTFFNDTVLSKMLTAFVAVYRTEIDEQYEGFRTDAVHTLGTRILSQVTSLDELGFNVISGIWDPNTHDEFNVPMLFCLKYLSPEEIDDWVRSVIGIQNHAWRFAFITWWLTYKKFLDRATIWPKDGKLDSIDQDKIVNDYLITGMKFDSLDAFIPQVNRHAFDKALAKHLTAEIYQGWADDITSRRSYVINDKELPIIEPALSAIQWWVVDFEQQFFAHKPSI